MGRFCWVDGGTVWGRKGGMRETVCVLVVALALAVVAVLVVALLCA